MRIALPAGDSDCAIDSAAVRVRRDGAPEQRIPMAVSDSTLEADVVDLEAGATEFAVFAYGRGGALAYYGAETVDPASAGSAGVTIAVGRVGRIRMEAGFRAREID